MAPSWVTKMAPSWGYQNDALMGLPKWRPQGATTKMVPRRGWLGLYETAI